MTMAKLIVVEGGDNLGKNTQTRMLVDYLHKIGFKATSREVPIKNGLTYDLVYIMLRNGLASKFPKLFQTIQFLNKFLFQFELKSLLKNNDYVILDRWSLSSVVYGVSSGIDRKFCERLYNWLIKPDFTIVLQGNKVSVKDEDVYEKNSALQIRVAQEYDSWVLAQKTGKAIRVSNKGTRTEVHGKIRSALAYYVETPYPLTRKK